MRGILIVDDDRHLAASLAQYLGHEGFETVIAHNGQEAVDLLKRCQRLPEAVLVDLVMPVMDGPELIKQLGNEPKWAEIPVLVVTSTEPGRLPNLGHAKHVFHKPLDIQNIVAALTHYCRRTA